MRQIDAWLISDNVDGSGDVIADCGPLDNSRGSDFGAFWRVWDGETWRQDRNVVAEAVLGENPPNGLQGLRVLVSQPCSSAPAAVGRASSQEPINESRPEARTATTNPVRASSGRPGKHGMAYPAAAQPPKLPDAQPRARFTGTEGLPH